MRLGALAAAVLLGGCAAVGPDYRQPRLSVPHSYLEADDREALSDAEIASWWRSFGDEQLSALVERALLHNLDIESAAARIREARALERAAGAGALPQVAADASASRQRISENAIPVPRSAGNSGLFGIPGEEFSTFRVGFDAAWEIDLFGRTRRGVEAARARIEAAIWNRRDVEVTVAAEVASAYLRLRSLQARIDNAEAELARQQRLERLVRARANGGLVTSQNVEEQRSHSAAAASAIPRLGAQADAEVHALALLTGARPAEIASELAQVRAPPSPPHIPAGLPSDLLRRRPDIRAAERQLAAATADVGVAVADLYPRFSLTAAPALVSTALASLLDWGSRSYSAGAAIGWPLFDGGRRRAGVDAADARREQALIAYRKAMLAGLRDVEDALSRIQSDREQLDRLQEALGTASRAEQIARTRYGGGLVTYSDVLQTQARRLSLEEQVIETRGILGRDSVALFKALGGGWQSGESGQ